MGIKTDNAPVGHTCPMIDGVLDVIDTVYKNSEGMSRGEFDYLKTTLEKIRSHNAQLRDWGNENYDRVNELQDEVVSFDNYTKDLESQIEDYKTDIKELNNQLNEAVSV